MQQTPEAKKHRNHLFVALTLALVAVIAVVVVSLYLVYQMAVGTHNIDTIEFKPINPTTASSGAEPGIWIDTNIEANLLTGRSRAASPTASLSTEPTTVSPTCRPISPR